MRFPSTSINQTSVLLSANSSEPRMQAPGVSQGILCLPHSCADSYTLDHGAREAPCMKLSRTILFPLAAIPLLAASLQVSKPEDVGMSTERLQRIHEMIQRHIAAGDISGAVTLVARRGRVAH